MDNYREPVEPEKNDPAQPDESANSGEEDIMPFSVKYVDGRLPVFLFGLAFGGLYTFIEPIINFSFSSYRYNYYYVASNVFVCVGVLILSMYTLYTFFKRKENAVFLGKACLAVCFIINLAYFLINGGEGVRVGVLNNNLLSLVYYIVLFVFLCCSKRVGKLYPRQSRRVLARDYYLVAVILLVPYLLFGKGYLTPADKKKINTELREFNSKPLADDEYTDGRLVFRRPVGFVVEKEREKGICLFSLIRNDAGGCLIICANDFNMAYEAYRDSWKDYERGLLKCDAPDIISARKREINSNLCYYETARYYHTKITLVRQFAILYDKYSLKSCIVFSLRSEDEADYMDEILSSIRFR